MLTCADSIWGRRLEVVEKAVQDRWIATVSEIRTKGVVESRQQEIWFVLLFNHSAFCVLAFSHLPCVCLLLERCTVTL
jgi:hypothetical protein